MARTRYKSGSRKSQQKAHLLRPGSDMETYCGRMDARLTFVKNYTETRCKSCIRHYCDEEYANLNRGGDTK